MLGPKTSGLLGLGRPQMDARDRLIFALDYPSLDEARAGASCVRREVGMLKVGLELFLRDGRAATELAAEQDLELFLDLKLHDIPETVGRAVRSAAGLGARYLTVHASGGARMLREAVLRAEEVGTEGGKLEIVAVTVLTSLDGADLAEQGIDRSAAAQVLALATMAWQQGVRAYVCSPSEASALREHLGPAATIITPGIRAVGALQGDQKRVSTPAGAILGGADRIVVGRPIRDAADPALAARSIVDEIRAASRMSR